MNFFDDRHYKLSNCHSVIKGVATVFYIIADVIFWLSVIGITIWSITMAVDTESFLVFVTIFFPSLIASGLVYLSSIFSCHLLFSWGEKVEHAKKQTELLKILAIEKNKE